jgi:hypothetical protein
MDLGRLRTFRVRRTPFTLATLAALVFVAVFTSTDASELTRSLLARVGFAPRDLFLEWWRVFVSALVTDGGLTFVGALVAVAAFVGSAEWLRGPARAAATFWGVHVATLLVESLGIALPMHLFGSPLGTALAVARDVGPSAGYMGCAGLAAASLAPRFRARAGVAGAVLLAVLLAVAYVRAGRDVTDLSASIAHLIAFPLGYASARLGSDAVGRRRSTRA